MNHPFADSVPLPADSSARIDEAGRPRLSGGAEKPRGTRSPKTVALHFNSFGAGGVQRCLRVLAGCFQAMGKRVVYVSETPAPEEEKRLFPEGVAFHSIRKGPDETLSDEQRDLRWAEAIRLFSVDAVYDACYHVPHLARDIRCLHACGVPVVVHYHTVFSSRLAFLGPTAFLRRLEGWRLADAFIVLSRTDARFFGELGIPCRVLPNPPTYPVPRVPGPRTLSGANRMVWCGQIRDVPKRPSDAVKILAAVRRAIPGATLTVIGDATASPVSMAAKEAMKRCARELGCEDAVEWAGYHDDVSPFLAKSDVMVSTSAYEGAPMTFVEAFAHGLPLVAYALPYVESIQNREAARQVPQCDVDAAAGEIVALLSDGAAYRRASEAALGIHGQLAAFDQTAAWREILDGLPSFPSVRPAQAAEAGSVKLVLETLLEHAAFWERQQEEESVARERHLAGEVGALRAELENERNRSAILDTRVATLERSISLRLGLALTAPIRRFLGKR